MEKEKIQNIFRSIIKLILEYNETILSQISKNTELFESNFKNLANHILDINAQFSSYQLRSNYDKDPEYIKRIERQKRDLELIKTKTKELKDRSKFLLGQTILNTEKLNTLLEDINFTINDL